MVLARSEDVPAIAGTTDAIRSRGGAVTLLVGIQGDDARLAAAAQAAGIRDRRWLGAPGARWPGRPARRYTSTDSSSQTGWLESLEAADPGEVAADIAATIDLVKPHAVVAPGDDDADPDRSRIRNAARAAADVMGVPVYAISRPDQRGGIKVEVAPGPRAAAAAALGVPAPSGSVERFRRVRLGSPQFAQYGVGARILTVLVSLAVGAFAGFLLTAVHQASFRIGEVTIPWGVIAAVLVTFSLLVGLRVVFGARVVAFIAALGLLATSVLYAMQTSGGQVPVPANTAGYVWTFTPVVLGLAVLLWPRLGARRAQ